MFQIPAAPLGLPIAYKGHYYGRDGESLVALNLHEIELIRSQANARADWSAEVIAGAGIDDLDSKAIAVARENISCSCNGGTEDGRYDRKWHQEDVRIPTPKIVPDA